MDDEKSHMNLYLWKRIALCAMVWSASAGAGYPQDAAVFPHLKKQGTATQLIVRNKPFLMLAGELGNSSASDMKHMAPIWPKLKTMRLNTVLIPVYWELLEPEEGRFEFDFVGGLIASTRKYDLKLVILWFGSWKNSMSCYVPGWVKTDQRRFPRARHDDGRPLEILTPFADQNLKADAKAFAAFMKYLRAFDGEQNTVIMVQVENEIGMKSSGTWEQLFGKGSETDELFMAWHFARYANSIAQAGKKEYPLPMYVNAALIAPGAKPGQYPSGGPLPHLMDIWRSAAPHIDFLTNRVGKLCLPRAA